jgi:conjugal transfer pilus assembly protein TraW
MFKILVSLLVVSFVYMNANTKDLGKYGATFQVKEQDVIEYIENKLKALEASGELLETQQQAIKKTKSKLKNPDPVAGIIDTENEREYYYDPTYVLKEDLKDHEDNVIHKKGYTVNPLSKVSFGPDMLFINGEDERQVDWAKSYSREPFVNHSKGTSKTTAKIVLVRGSPIDLEEKLGIRIYFDQLGSITKKLGIKQVPAVVSGEGMRLKIQELKPENLVQKISSVKEEKKEGKVN